MSFSRATWRLIDTGPGDGATNMAVDEALLSLFDPLTSHPILRLYSWEPPALSLGRFQDRDLVLDIERCTAAGVAVVPRITGGGVIYHTAEITYSIVCTPSHVPSTRSIKESFRVLTSFLIGFYRTLGLNACYAVDARSDDESLGRRTPFCFSGRETYDILVEGRKIGGNAQRRQRDIVFQHGSVPLRNHAGEGAAFMREHLPDVGGTVAALSDLGIHSSVEELKSLLASSFEETMGVDLVADVLTEEEKGEAARLAAEKV